MAYMNQERKAKLQPKIKEICSRYGIKATLAIRHHSTLVLNVKQGSIDFIEDYIEADRLTHHGRKMEPDQIEYLRKNKTIQVNPYWYHEHFSGKAKEFLSEVIPAMNEGNHDRSDIMTDYFDVGWYTDVNIGKWNSPYAVVR